jgi:hypothetical protein
VEEEISWLLERLEYTVDRLYSQTNAAKTMSDIAELGMADRTGGPNSVKYAHRTRPERYEEDDRWTAKLRSLPPSKHAPAIHE